MKNQVLPMAFLMFMLFCCKDRSHSRGSEIINLRIDNDTVLVDSSGHTWIVKNNAKEKELKGTLNGTVIYSYTTSGDGFAYDRDGQISKIIYKRVYWNDTLKISIKKDTVNVGKDFRASIWSSLGNYDVDIVSPERKIIHSDQDGSVELTMLVSKKGRNKFQGTIKQDSVVIPFEYDFLVN